MTETKTFVSPIEQSMAAVPRVARSSSATSGRCPNAAAWTTPGRAVWTAATPRERAVPAAASPCGRLRPSPVPLHTSPDEHHHNRGTRERPAAHCAGHARRCMYHAIITPYLRCVPGARAVVEHTAAQWLCDLSLSSATCNRARQRRCWSLRDDTTGSSSPNTVSLSLVATLTGTAVRHGCRGGRSHADGSVSRRCRRHR